jgi:hypothetical protein
MRCARHGLAAGPNGECALCHRGERAEVRGTDRRIHRGLRVVIAIITGVTTYVLLMAAFDTRRPVKPETPLRDAAPE